MTKQATMRTRNAKTPVKTPLPAKKGPKTPVKAEAQPPADDNPVIVDLTTAVAVGLEAKLESIKNDGSDKAEGEATVVNGKPSVEAGNEVQEQDAKSKVTSPTSAKKQIKGAGAKSLYKDGKTLEGKSETEAEETATEVVLEPPKGMDVEDAAEDEEMEENAGDDADEDEDESEGEEEEGEEGVEDEGNEEVGDENVEDEEEEEEDGGEEEGEGEEADEVAVADVQPELQAPKLVTERQKSKRLEVFVGGLDKEATEDDVKKAFESVGEVVEVRLRKNVKTGKNKGYAFVRFASAEQATRAYTELERTQIGGKSCHVVPSEDNNVLFVGNLNKSWKKGQVEEKLKEYGVQGIEELTLMEDTHNDGMNRGFAFIELATHNDALKTLKRLAKPDALFGSDRSAKVAWAQQNEPDKVVMSQVKTVFVDGIPTKWGEEKVKEHFGKYGEIERIVLACNMSRSKRNDFAFVSFAQRDAAVACIDALKDLEEVVDGEDKIKVKVKLAQPRPKGKAAKGGVRGGYPVGAAARPGRGRGISRGGFNSRRPGRGGRGFIRGGGRALGRAYGDPGVHKLVRVLKQRAVGDERLLLIERSKERRLSGGLARSPRIPRRDGYSRREDVRRDRINRPASYDYRMPPRYDIRDDYLPRRGFSQHLPGRRSSQSEHLPLPPRDDGYFRHAGHSYDHDREMGVGFGRVRAPGPGIKRAYSALDDDPSYYSGPSGYTRPRIEYGDASSQYDPFRAPVGRSMIGATGRTPLPPAAGGPVTQSSHGLYDQSGGLSGSASSLYGSGNPGYGSSLSGVADYVSSGTEGRGASLYGVHSGSSGYNYSGATGSASYY